MLSTCLLGNAAFLQMRKLALGDSSLVVAAGMGYSFTQKPPSFVFPTWLFEFPGLVSAFSPPTPLGAIYQPNCTVYGSVNEGRWTDGCLCLFQTAGNKCELLARTWLSEGLGPGGEGQSGSEVALVSGMTLHKPQKLPTQVSQSSSSHPAPRTPGATPSAPSCRILLKSEGTGGCHRLLSLLEALMSSDYRKTLHFPCLLRPLG